MSTKQNIVPIFYSTDDNYAPWLAASLKSLVDNSSPNNKYVVHILNRGLKNENIEKLTSLVNNNVSIKFVDVTEKIKPFLANLAPAYYFSVQMYFRIFIASMFPEFDKVIYIDCDTIVLSDIAQLYATDLQNNILGAAVDQIVSCTKPFHNYVRYAGCVDHTKYFNSGVLVINAKKFREEEIEKKFLDILVKYNFDLIAPDQDYLNFLCKDKVFYLDNSWNKMPLNNGHTEQIHLIHYNFFKKPWKDAYVKYRKFFWDYIKKTPYYDYALEYSRGFTILDRQNVNKALKQIVAHANEVVASKNNFYQVFEASKEEKVEKIKFSSVASIIADGTVASATF